MRTYTHEVRILLSTYRASLSSTSRSSLSGTVHQRFSSADAITLPLSTCGLLVVFSRRWPFEVTPSSQGIQKLIRFSRFSGGYSRVFSISYSYLSDRILGTPNEQGWPGVSDLPDYKPTFPQWSRQELAKIVPTLDETGLDMLKVRAVGVRRLPVLIGRGRKLSYTTQLNVFRVSVKRVVWFPDSNTSISQTCPPPPILR